MRSKILALVVSTTIFAANQADADGKSVFEQACSKCHRTGVLNAPIAGNKVMWEPRVKLGKEKLYESVINGKNDMPAKGGKEQLTDDEVKAAVDYMVNLVGL